LEPRFPEALLRGVMPGMTRSRYRIFETEYPYFLTSTIVGWLPVFTRSEAVNIVSCIGRIRAPGITRDCRD
jgi:hypothetical protein